MSRRFSRALVRTPARSFAQGLRMADRGRPDPELMLRQHQQYVEVLRRLGLEVTVLQPLEGFPDAHFVEDAAVVTPRLAVMTRPGALERQGETGPLEPEVARWREVAHIRAPGTLDGGDVLEVGQEVFVGLSGRTNRQGFEQLGRLLAPQGYRCTAVRVSEGLHLTSSVTCPGSGTLLLAGAFAAVPEFQPYRRIVVEPAESAAANVLPVNGTVLVPAGFPRTRRALEAAGFPTLEVDNSEARKMDGALTCMSLLF